jgi:tellurite resistance protein
VAGVLWLYLPGMALALTVAALAVHVSVAVSIGVLLVSGGQIGPARTPALIIVFVGVIVSIAALIPAGVDWAVAGLMWYALAVSTLICGLTLRPLFDRDEAPPLRPLHVIHVAPAGLVATAAFAVGTTWLGVAMLVWTSFLLVLLGLRLRWLLAGGFTPLWSAMTFPLSALAGAWLAAGAAGSSFAAAVGGAVLLLATAVTWAIALRVLRLWAGGSLGKLTGAAVA